MRSSRPSPPPISEAQLEQYGTDLLELDGWRSLKTDPVSDRSRGKGFGEKGMADRLYLRYGYNDVVLAIGPSDDKLRAQDCEILWIEWKRPGGRASTHQRHWIACERASGALVLLAGEDFPATPEGFLAWYRGSGLMRKAIQ